MKKRIMLVIGICFLLAGCRAVTAKSDSVALDSATKQLQREEQSADINGTEAVVADAMIRTTTSDLQKLPQEIQDILFGDGRFYDVEENKEFSRATLQMTDCDTDSSTDVLWNEFLVADVDQDGTYELAVHMTGKDEECLMEYDVLMFHLSEGTVYAHPYSFRAITGVYENGVVLGSSGAADNVWYHIQYDKEVESQTVEAYSETAYTEGEGARIHYYIEGEMVSEGTFYEYIGEKYGSENIRGENAKILWSEEKIKDRK